MADTSKHLSPGERWQPTADAINGYQNAADYVRNLKVGGGALPGLVGQRQVVLATVKNSSGRDCDRFDILGIDCPIFPPDDAPSVFTSRVGVSCVTPELANHVTRFVVLLEPAAQDTLATACLIGVVPVRLKVIFEWHQFAHVENEEATRLVSDGVGYPILWKDDAENADENGNRWALVQIGCHMPALGVWKNEGYLVAAHEHFQITGVDSTIPSAILGTRPSDRFGPDYAVNGSQPVESGEYGVYQRSDDVFIAYGSTAPELGDHLGPAPGSGTVATKRPPTCHCLGIVDADHGIALATVCQPVQRFKLLEPLYECGTADAQIMGRSGYNYITITDYASAPVSDTFGAVAQSPLSVRDSQSGKLYIPAGKCLNARYAHSPGDFWEAIDFGECACGGTSGSSQSSFSSGSSGSGSSSKSDSGSQSGSQSDSGSGQSGSGSGGSEGSGSTGSQGSGGSGGGSDKSTAIVPASWSPTGYTALFIAECPEVRFDDVLAVTIPQKNTDICIDRRFLEVCEPDTILACGCVADIPVLVGAVAEAGRVRLRFAEENMDQEVRLTIRLTGIRKGFRGKRFPNRTQRQFEANERFIRSAYSHE